MKRRDDVPEFARVLPVPMISRVQAILRERARLKLDDSEDSWLWAVAYYRWEEAGCPVE